MKKLLLSITVAVLILGTTVACKKSGTCVCKVAGIEISSEANMSKADCNKVAEVSGADCSIK